MSKNKIIGQSIKHLFDLSSKFDDVNRCCTLDSCIKLVINVKVIVSLGKLYIIAVMAFVVAISFYAVPKPSIVVEFTSFVSALPVLT